MDKWKKIASLGKPRKNMVLLVWHDEDHYSGPAVGIWRKAEHIPLYGWFVFPTSDPTDDYMIKVTHYKEIGGCPDGLET